MIRTIEEESDLGNLHNAMVPMTTLEKPNILLEENLCNYAEIYGPYTKGSVRNSKKEVL
jgi:hypothetical protein